MGKLNIIDVLENIRSFEGKGFECDDKAILIEYQKKEEEKTSLAIKILSIFGSLMAVFVFIWFLYIIELFDSGWGMLLLGIGLLVAAIGLSRKYETFMFDTFCVSLYVLGFVLFVFDMLVYWANEDNFVPLSILIALCCFFFAKNYIISFISILAVGTNILMYIISKDIYDAIHGYIALNTCVFVYCFLNEAKLITSYPKLSKLYDPLRIGLVFCFLFGLVPFGMYSTFPVSQNFIWISSIVIILAILYVVRHILKTLNINSKKSKVWIYSLSSLALLPTLFAPAICGALLIMLSAFWVNHKTGLAIGIIALVYFVIQYYYDLDLTLLTKSTILFSSGVVFVLLYLFFTKKTQSP
ncbi:MAG: DUF4401 domain-containing protein [Bacteroidota bacterium]|uniref:DUF4401 domain-containing protein n=1 Tax=Flagellimonas profundi TaxID=2915620 RepID=A0ABS3FGE2_9FLAO|nr:DUF4401 domain-containing protein [Allomuricauda profundi]MBO0342046.1 DUF4401 domain-containing protein [Allomuricauda profundi]MEC7769952.1 DUF4401 domain-containing protein [Bacteroidota bacterium]